MNGLAFRDFTVRRSKVTRALYWLKENNRYYADVVIDEQVLQFLPKNGSIDDQLRHLEDGEYDFDDDNNDPEGTIGSNFIPTPFPSPTEKCAIADACGRIQANDDPIMWPDIDGHPINEFQILCYIACTFPTLYPTEKADFHSEHIRDVNPTEYFSHLLKYKDRRFAHHTRWRYFALNSQMRWRALQEGKVYVKQRLNDKQFTVKEVQDMVNVDTHMIKSFDLVKHYAEFVNFG